MVLFRGWLRRRFLSGWSGYIWVWSLGLNWHRVTSEILYNSLGSWFYRLRLDN